MLVNARHVKNVPGRKTDVVDCQWIQELHEVGLLRGRFRPSADIVSRRASLRHRETLVPVVPAGLPADLVARRPDLVAAERDVATAQARINVARAELLPRISLTAATGTATNSLRSLLDGSFGVWSLLGNMVQPLWQGGRLRAQISRAEARGPEVLAQYATLALGAYAEVETALAAED